MNEELIEKFKTVRRMLNIIKYFRKNGMDYPVGPLSLYKTEQSKLEIEKKLFEELKGLEKKCLENNVPKEFLMT